MAPSLCSVSSATRFIRGGFVSSIRGLLGSATEKKDLKSSESDCGTPGGHAAAVNGSRQRAEEAEPVESPATQPDAGLVYEYMNGDLITYGFRLVEAELLVLGIG